jgi:hypothetical protein
MDLLSRLLSRDYASLNVLPKSSTIELVGYSKPVSLTTYRETDLSGTIKVVVQLAVTGWLGSASFWVEGFKLVPGGSPVKLQTEELYDYH